MKTRGFSVFDRAAQAFLPLFFLPTRGVAMRSFSEAVNDPKHEFHKHAKDYELYELCEFDDQSGQVSMVSTEPMLVARGEDVVLKVA